MRQIAALPYRMTAEPAVCAVDVLLVTSRRTGRWVVPKGNPMKGLSRPAAAAQEALEEGGVTGVIGRKSLGRYRVWKQLPTGEGLWLEVDLFPLAVTSQFDSWLEQSQRSRRWFSQAQAAESVDEADLRELIRNFRASPAKCKP